MADRAHTDLVAIVSAVFLGEQFGGSKVSGLALGFLGAAFAAARGDPGAGVLAAPAPRDDLLFVAITLNWAVYSVIGHGTLRRVGLLRATAGAMLAGWVFLLPLFAGGRAWNDFARLSWSGWLALLFLGITCSGLGYLLWYEALERLEASRVAPPFLYVEPLVTLAAAMLILGEKLTPAAGFGGGLLLLGVGACPEAPQGVVLRSRTVSILRAREGRFLQRAGGDLDRQTIPVMPYQHKKLPPKSFLMRRCGLRRLRKLCGRVPRNESVNRHGALSRQLVGGKRQRLKAVKQSTRSLQPKQRSGTREEIRLARERTGEGLRRSSFRRNAWLWWEVRQAGRGEKGSHAEPGGQEAGRRGGGTPGRWRRGHRGRLLG